jgi:superfamily II DNA or RNA helicase
MTNFLTNSPAPKKPELWKHQKEALHACLKSLRPGQPIMLQLPTGSGKSRVIGEIVKSLPGKRILIITARTDLVKQNCDELDGHGVYCASLERLIANIKLVNIGTYHTMIRMTELDTPDVIIVDECHMVPEAGDYRELLARFPQSCLVGLTATPYRGVNHIRECGIDWKTVYAVTIADLIQQKIIVPPVSMATSNAASFDSLDGKTKRTRQEVTPQICVRLVQSVQRHGRLKTLIFCEDIGHAEETASILRSLGEQAVFVVHSKMSRSKRESAYQGFASSNGRSWLVNVGLVTIGVNIRSIDCIAILRDVSSYSLLVQMIGRGLRKYLNKKDCLVFDFGKGTSRFGFLDSPNFGKSPSGQAEFLFKGCPECEANVPLASQSCPHCGFEFSLDAEGLSGASSLSNQATDRQLISRDFLVLTYDLMTEEPNKRGQVICSHRLKDNTGAVYRAITTYASKLANAERRYSAGKSLLTYRIDRSDNLVEIIA